MVLDATILNQIRDEVGSDTDYNDAAVEVIYVDENRGNFSTLVTALIIWRRRLHDLQTRSFDVTTGGNLYSRNQRIRFIERRIKELELVADQTLSSINVPIITPAETEAALISGAEFD